MLNILRIIKKNSHLSLKDISYYFFKRTFKTDASFVTHLIIIDTIIKFYNAKDSSSSF